MKKFLLVGAAAMLASVSWNAASAGGGTGGGDPPTNPGEDPPGGPGDNPGDPGDGGLGGGDGGTGGGGGTTTTPPAASMLVGSGSSVFNLDNLPTGPSGSMAAYQPYQDNSGLGVSNNPSAQLGLNQTASSGLTVSLRTADWYDTGTAPQTRIAVENMSSFFGYLGAPAANQITVQAGTFSTAAPGALYANFSQAISYFSVEAIKLFGNFSYNVSFAAYSGQNGTGTLLGTTSGTVGSISGYKSSLFELTNLSGAQSVAILSDSNNTRFDNITAEVAPVPEPGEWAMMIAGLGVVGAVARRRKARTA